VVIEEIPTEDFRDTEYEMTVRNLLEDIHAEPLPEFHHAFLMARWTKMPSFTREAKHYGLHPFIPS
jgi:predicted lipid carrier protein YhbT